MFLVDEYLKLMKYDRIFDDEFIEFLAQNRIGSNWSSNIANLLSGFFAD